MSDFEKFSSTSDQFSGDISPHYAYSEEQIEQNTNFKENIKQDIHFYIPSLPSFDQSLYEGNHDSSFQYDEILRIYKECTNLLQENKRLSINGEIMKNLLGAQRKLIRKISNTQENINRNRETKKRKAQNRDTITNNENMQGIIYTNENTPQLSYPSHASKNQESNLNRSQRDLQNYNYLTEQKSSIITTPTHRNNVKNYHSFPNQWINEITLQEFESIPKYVKNRITLFQLNDFVLLVNYCIREKYINIQQNWREKELDEHLETRLTEGHYWISDKILIETGKWKQGTHGVSLLGCLRYLKKMKIEKSKEMTRIIILETKK